MEALYRRPGWVVMTCFMLTLSTRSPVLAGPAAPAPGVATPVTAAPSRTTAPASTATTAGPLGTTGPARSSHALPLDGVSPRLESYLFAASEAISARDPALALLLLKRAQAEEPDACIVHEYVCRTYLELGDLSGAQAAYQAFSGCMRESDAPVRDELEQRIRAVAAIRSSASSPFAVISQAPPGQTSLAVRKGGAEDPASSSASPVAAGDASTLFQAAIPGPDRRLTRGQKAARLLMGLGGMTALGFGATATVTWLQAQADRDTGDVDLYEARRPLNHVAVVLTGVAGGISVSGLVLELVNRRGHRSAAKGRPEKTPAVSARLELTPTRAGGQVGVSGAF